MSTSSSTDDFLEFVGGRTLSSVTSIPTQPASAQPASATQVSTSGIPNTIVPTQPVLRPSGGKTNVSLLNEYVQRQGRGNSGTVNYSFIEGQGFRAVVNVLERRFEDTTFYSRKQEAKESISRIALSSLESGVDILPAAISVAPSQPSPSNTERKLIAWLTRNRISRDGRWEEAEPGSTPAEPKRPVSILYELCTILQLNPNFVPSDDPQGLYICTLSIGDHAYHSSPSYYPNECKDAVAQFAIEDIVANYFNGQMMSALPPGSPSAIITVHVPPPASPLPPPVPSHFNSDGAAKPSVNLLHELCTMRRLGEPTFVYEEQPSRGFICHVRVKEMVVDGIMYSPKKGDAKENAAKRAYEHILENSPR